MSKNNNLVKLCLHGDLAQIGAEWEFSVNSVQGAIHALDEVTNYSFSDYFFKKNKLQAKYRVLINGKDFVSPVGEINGDNYEKAFQSELVMKKENIKTIDIVPFIENSDSKTLGIILGVILIIIGVLVIVFSYGSASGVGVTLILAGIGLAVTALLTRPPELPKNRGIDKAGNESYLFGGPVNLIGEGGPVPVGYGRLLVGSQVIASAYKIVDYQTFRR